MANKNTSDSIENILGLAGSSWNAELKKWVSRCLSGRTLVRLNYVIKTRFTEPGYIVENSKRGGGGYISALAKVQFFRSPSDAQDLAANIGETIQPTGLPWYPQMLYEEKLLTQREAQLLLATTSDEGP